MPVRKRTVRRRRVVRRKPRSGGSAIEKLKKVNDFLKRTKAISKVSSTLGNLGLPYANSIANVSGKLGYGRRRPRKCACSGGCKF